MIFSDPIAPDREPLITVIIPTYNRSRELRLCLEGFANQTTPRERFEVMVVDDGSAADISDVCRPFQDRVQLIFIRQENQGASVARNTAIVRARAPYLLLYDDDLRPFPDVIERCIAFHRDFPGEGDCALLRFCPQDEFADEPLRRWAFPRLYPFPAREGVGNWRLFWSGSTTVKKSLFVKAPFNPKYRSLEDVELALRLSRAVDLRVHYDARPAGIMTRQLEPAQIFTRFYLAGYFRFHICRDYPGETGSLKWADDPERHVILDPSRLAALVASVRALQSGSLNDQRFRMISALWTRAHAHAEGEGWLDSCEGRPSQPPGSIRQFLGGF
jgi:glycosyltransferase involved in cell wall biosynthesis